MLNYICLELATFTRHQQWLSGNLQILAENLFHVAFDTSDLNPLLSAPLKSRPHGTL